MMKPEINALWKLIDLLRRVQIGLLNGLQKPAVTDTNKFPLEVMDLFRELASLIRKTFRLSDSVKLEQMPTEYRQVVFWLARDIGLDKHTHFREDDAFRYLERPCTDLQSLADGKNNHRDGIRRIFALCRALETQCLAECNIPGEKASRKKEGEEEKPQVVF